jgi:hypothetical protein
MCGSIDKLTARVASVKSGKIRLHDSKQKSLPL